jgi:hypothetical protein
MRKYAACLVVLLLILAATPLLAQETTVRGAMSGVVLDSTGAVIPDAKVTINGPTGTRSAQSDSAGRFVFDVLIPGFYGVKAEKQGFKSAEVKGAQVFTGRTSSVRFSLVPGAVSETVEVTAGAVAVDTASTNVSTNLNDTFYQNVPVARNVAGLFYASSGVTSGQGTGAANPSISGGSGLENQYVADGVNITDGAFGGLGVFSREYGSLATGINLAFVKEVQVKTGGYEPQYGKSTGGVVQIVTKSGSTAFHGGVTGYYQPQEFEKDRLTSDSFGRFNQEGQLIHQGAWDVTGEIGGYVPRLQNQLFFFGSYNPSWNRNYQRFATLHGLIPSPQLGSNVTINSMTNNYSGKLTYKINENHQLEGSVFGDPSSTDNGPHFGIAFPTLTSSNTTGFSKLSYGGRNVVGRYNGTLSPTWLVNASLSWGHNNLAETPQDPNIYQIQDVTAAPTPTAALIAATGVTAGSTTGLLGPLTGTYLRQGRGYIENTSGDNYGLTLDTQKMVKALGTHTLSLGWHYERNYYDGRKSRTGPSVPIFDDPNVTSLAGIPATFATDMGAPQAAGLMTNYSNIQLRVTTDPLAPTMFVPGQGVQHVVLRNTRGEFGPLDFNTSGRYHAIYGNDSWSPNKHLTLNLGLRWEQQHIQGTKFVDPATGIAHAPKYTFTHNWSPRVGVSIDPFGDRKTKIYGNYALYSYALPLDVAIRSLSNEQDVGTAQWFPVANAANQVVVNPDNTIANPVFDAAHYAGTVAPAALQTTEAIASGTRMMYLQEFVGGIQRELPHGVIAEARWIDRRVKRIVEDMSGSSPEGSLAGVVTNYVIGNPSSSLDLFTNENLITSGPGVSLPAACNGAPFSVTDITDSAGANRGNACVTNADAGVNTPDGKPDGFVGPVRDYMAVEIEIAKNFSSGWQWRTNYRWAQLYGNYEGAFRNDNGQSDPGISSLFDFTQGQLGLLGTQFQTGWLNTDVHHTFNSFLSYTFGKTMLKNLTVGTGVRIQTGTPISQFGAHPVYQDAGEIPEGRRGLLGRTPTVGQADLHLDYVVKVGEKSRLHFGGDMFNITNERTQIRYDQNIDRAFQIPNADFLKPAGSGVIGAQNAFQRPFYGRLMAKWEF